MMFRKPGARLRRFFMAAISVSVVCFALIVPAAFAKMQYPDVDSRYSWAASSIAALTDKQVLTGYPDGLFYPDKAVTKAEWSAMVYRLFDQYRPNMKAAGVNQIRSFADVPSSHWANKPISELYDTSFRTGGYGLNQGGQLAFAPDLPMTRMKLAQILYASFDGKLMDSHMSDHDACAIVLDMKDVPVSLFANADDYALAKTDGRYNANGLMYSADTDIYPSLAMGRNAGDCQLGDDPLSKVQIRALASLQSSGIMTKDGSGYLRPSDPITRAEAVTILDRAYRYLQVNRWLLQYSTIDLSAVGGTTSRGTGTGTNASSGTAAGDSSGQAAPRAPFNHNADRNVIVPPNQPPSSANDWTDKSVIRVTDYFNDQGVITKNIGRNGEIETAVQPKGTPYLTIDLKSAAKVDLYVILDGKVGFLKQEELPFTLPVANVEYVGLRTQQRSTVKTNADNNAVLSVQVTDQEPNKKKK